MSFKIPPDPHPQTHRGQSIPLANSEIQSNNGRFAPAALGQPLPMLSSQQPIQSGNMVSSTGPQTNNNMVGPQQSGNINAMPTNYLQCKLLMS